MPNRDHDDSQLSRTADRLPGRDERSARDRGDRGDSGAKPQDYAPEWRSYAQDWSDHGRAQREADPPRDLGSDELAENPFHAQERTRQEYNRTIGTGHYARESYGPSFSASPDFGRVEPAGWGQQIRHAGHQVVSRVRRVFRGPRGYRRSDERISEDVNEGLAQQFDFDPSDLEVSVTGGEVTLSGTVRSRSEKFIAEEIAAEVSGVHEVHNQIRVRRLDQRSRGQSSSSHGTIIAGPQNHDVPRA